METFQLLFLIFVPMVASNFHLGGPDEPYLKKLYAKLDEDCRISLDLCQKQAEVIGEYMNNLRYLVFSYEKHTPASLDFASRTENLMQPLRNVKNQDDVAEYTEKHYPELKQLYLQTRELASLMPDFVDGEQCRGS